MESSSAQAGEAALLVGLVCLAAFFAGSEVAFLGVPRTWVRQTAESGSKLGRLLLTLQERRAIVLATMLVGITGSYYVAEHIAVVLCLDWLGPTLGAAVASTVALVGLTVVVLIFAEATPMQFAARNVKRVATYSAPIVALFSVLLYPVVSVLGLLVRGLMYLSGAGAQTMLPSVTEDQLKAMIEEGQSQGALALGTGRMLHGALDFGDQTAAQVMTPRPDMKCVDETASIAEALAVAMESKHSRLPVYAEDRDHITGILYVKDLLPYVRLDEMDTPVRTVARPPHFVPESLSADELLRQLRVGRRTMAIVYDEFGGTAGLVTVEDLLEEIVGDIQDEYDIEQPEIVRQDTCLLCDASIGLHELDNLVGEALPTEQYDSLGGVVLELAGRIPESGESFRWGSLTLTVERMDGPRIARVRVTERPIDEDEQADGESSEGGGAA
ncbi:MAG: hemolysin family protein [Armatimonadota bacterium]|nr:hemolysin family protein [Armatimonadota bacterium]